MKESEIQKACLEFLQWNKIFCYINTSSGVYDPTRRVFRTNKNMKGVSDIIGICPDGRFLAIEIKAEKEKVSEDQQVFLENVATKGGVAFVARSVDELESKLMEYHII